MPAKKRKPQDKKALLDQELEAYALSRKQEIKQSILAVNDELVAKKAELEQCSSELETKRTELQELSSIYRDEQDELKQSRAETKRLLADEAAQRAEITPKIDELDRELKEMVYKKDQLMITVTKAREEHTKFVEYEQKARTLLAAKDRELQEKAAEINEGGQFLKNSRSFLAEL
jgi:uncharacterized coiled-coil DUF342 family protein